MFFLIFFLALIFTLSCFHLWCLYNILNNWWSRRGIFYTSKRKSWVNIVSYNVHLLLLYFSVTLGQLKHNYPFHEFKDFILWINFQNNKTTTATKKTATKCFYRLIPVHNFLNLFSTRERSVLHKYNIFCSIFTWVYLLWEPLVSSCLIFDNQNRKSSEKIINFIMILFFEA